ncbi:MAG: sigma-70 family RNA polymerase sigma factor [Chloroflexi bacterium]|nr:sigma-70 family RNA polymerase sigma factor [Chloroflexota bacterium]
MVDVDQALIARCQRGDAAAFADLVAITQNSVFNMAYRILSNREDAQDAAQEVYVRVWQGLPGYRSDSKFSTWLYRVTVNTCLNRKRQLRRELLTVEDDAILETVPEPSADPLHETLRNEWSNRIWKAVDALSDKYRLVITLFYQEELSYAEIAGLLTLPIGTVKAHLNRARLALAKSLSANGAL